MKEKDLYKIDVLAFNSKIGFITNLGTTFYEMQSEYEEGSKEYKEIDRRLKLCCIEQNRTIDAAKGLKTKPFPKHWTKKQKIEEDDSEEEKERKAFENKLVIEKRPEFMRYLYSRYNKEYKEFIKDFNLYSKSKYGKYIDELTDEDKKRADVQEMMEYYDKKNPLLETNGVMNKISRYMQKESKKIKISKNNEDSEYIYNKLINNNIEIDHILLIKMDKLRDEYYDFKKTRQLKDSEYSTYEQFYKNLRNKALEEISSNIKELANLAVYLSYKKYSTKPKDFCWDVFGVGIVENLKEKKKHANVPYKDEISGDIRYLGENYSLCEVYIGDDEDLDNGYEEEIGFEEEDDDIFSLDN